MISRSCSMAAHSQCRGNALACDCRCHTPGFSWKQAAEPIGIQGGPAEGRPEPAPRPPRKQHHPPRIELVWEEPTTTIRRNTTDQYIAVLAELRDKPGYWARIAVYTGAHAGDSVRTTLVARFPEYEFTVRRTDAGGSAIYARFPVEEEPA